MVESGCYNNNEFCLNELGLNIYIVALWTQIFALTILKIGIHFIYIHIHSLFLSLQLPYLESHDLYCPCCLAQVVIKMVGWDIGGFRIGSLQEYNTLTRYSIYYYKN